MNACVWIQFRMKCKCKLILVAYSHDTVIHNGKDLTITRSKCILIHFYNVWCADKGHRDSTYACDICFCMKT